MAKLPKAESTATQIIEWWGRKPQGNRPHLGASLIGHKCERHIWYSFRHAKTPDFNGRMLRLFDRGQKEEARFVEELRGIGVQVWDVDPETGDQIRVSAINGHFGGSCDGVGQGFVEAPKTPAVLEFKTHSAKSFRDVLDNGVIKSKPQHHAQMTVYMGLLELDRAMYIAVNKDTDDIYSEWVHYSKEFFNELIYKAERIINATTAPEKIGRDRSWWECRFCDHVELCHGENVANVNCRTCVNSTPVENAKWSCAIGKDMSEPCLSHLYLPDMIPYAKAIDGGEGYIEYELADGGRFINGRAPGQYISLEIAKCRPDIIGDEVMKEIKEVMDAKVMTVNDLTDDLDAIYKEDNSKQAQEFKKQLTQNQIFIEKFIKQKGLKE